MMMPRRPSRWMRGEGTGPSPVHRRRKMARMQHTLWAAADRYGISCLLPMRLHKHMKRLNLPRLYKHRRDLRHVTVRPCGGQYIAHVGKEMEVGRPYGVGSSALEAVENLRRVNERAV